MVRMSPDCARPLAGGASVRYTNDMNIEQAIERFRQAAIEKAEFTEPAIRDNVLHASMSKSWGELEEHGKAGRTAFKSLLSDESAHVRSWAASQLLALGDEDCVQVLEELVSSGGLLGFSAEMVLREWRAGRLRAPFGDSGT